MGEGMIITKSCEFLLDAFQFGKKCRKTFEKMERFSFVTPVTGLNRPNTGKEDDDNDAFQLVGISSRNRVANNRGVFKFSTN
jgi:hypothetical protein